MRTINFKSILLYSVFVVLFAVTGCEKDAEVTKTELLCQEWNLAHFYVEDQSVLTEISLGDLGIDMTLKFDKYHKVIISSTSDSETETADWNWLNDENTISIETKLGQEEWDVQKLTNQELWVRFQSEHEVGEIVFIVMKFARK